MAYLAENKTPLTLHIRLTKECNADCSYCSSYETTASERMDPEELRKCLSWIADEVWPNLGLNVGALTIEYVGGELLTLPGDYLEDCVNIARKTMTSRGISVHDGAQSNLIGSARKIERLHALFGSRISTSLDSRSGQRTIKGSADRYQTFFRQGDAHLTRTLGDKPAGAVITVDAKAKEHTLEEVRSAVADGRSVTIRPVFAGGMPIEAIGPNPLEEVYLAALKEWLQSGTTVVEPFFSLTKKRMITTSAAQHKINMDFCPHQANCAERSLSMEPNGDLYICQDMADSKEYPIGNAALREFDYSTWKEISLRPARLNIDCYSCDYFAACQGGCMLQSIQHGHGLWGKTEYCGIWKSLFAEIDRHAGEIGAPALLTWMDSLET